MNSRIIAFAAAAANLFGTTAWADNPKASVIVNATPGHAINPQIYGVSFGAPADLQALNAPLNRMGGDAMTTYSWKTNADNKANDYFFESISEQGTAPGAYADAFISANKAADAETMMTIPMIGWVAKLGAGRSILPSFSIAKYGAQCATDPYDSDAGDGLKTDCVTPITGNDPNDAYTADTAAAEQSWVKHLVSKWGAASAGGVNYYLLDNEPSIWFSTHRDVQPVGLHATAYKNDVINYSRAIKAIDPNALVVAPEEWGWDGYFYSGYDQQYTSQHGYSYYPDRSTEMGGQDYLPWLLKQWKAAGHPVDVFSVHFYPQGGEFSDDTSEATELLRNRSTRQLWDPKYVSESWIGQPVYLIPRLKSMVAQNYVATTPVALTEYNWGAEASINGATTQADIFGIFGKEGLDMATRWTVPAATTPTYKAMQMYRNYDAHHSTFGDIAAAAAVANPDDLSAYAATRSLDGALTIMVINKVLSGNTPLSLGFNHFTGAAAAKTFRLTSANTIAALPDTAVKGGLITDTLPPQSVTLYVLPAAGKALAQQPKAIASIKPATVYAVQPGQTLDYAVAFSATGSTPAAGQSITGYAWDFGDGTTSASVSAKHVYTAYGIYTATLTVTGSNGLIDIVTQQINVLPKLAAVTACSVTYTNTDDWGSGFTGDVKVANSGSNSIPYWVLTWQFPSGQTLTNMWSAGYIQNNAAVTVLPAAWTETIGAGAVIDFGFVANYPATNTAPASFKLNGTTCSNG